MKAFRIYHIDENGVKIYLCNRPGYCLHVSSDPEYAIPFLDATLARESAIFATKHVAPVSERYVEEYVEDRELAQHKYKTQIILAEMLWDYASSIGDFELIA